MRIKLISVFLPPPPNQNLSIDTDLHAANGKRVKALDIFAYALAFFKEQALKVVRTALITVLEPTVFFPFGLTLSTHTGGGKR